MTATQLQALKMKVDEATTPDEVPLIGGRTGPVLGFRYWVMDEHGRLRGCVHAKYWLPGENKAACATKTHRAPCHACGCGLYGWADLKSALNYLSFLEKTPPRVAVRHALVGGFVALWGKTYRHELGERAERGQVLALVGPSP